MVGTGRKSKLINTDMANRGLINKPIHGSVWTRLKIDLECSQLWPILNDSTKAFPILYEQIKQSQMNYIYFVLAHLSMSLYWNL